ncbi:hypothetical protein phi16_gp012 [Corynebacterium phage phi16]|uniref:hypothetical protein n=1 Tax=Corynebacterium glutamicum TaxID=1718 RepID=UPI00094431C1|nr:hypothetical protein [Corynebacterium glutamicum]APQ42517.1 hypothetical protein phi16_gp012 [Corynebacterium phage phi16]OKX80486.1 hypothetical protein AUO95_10050 [Corynebacterium glutamicum]
MYWFQQDAATLVRGKITQFLGDQGSRVHEIMPPKWTPRDGPIITVARDGPQSSQYPTNLELVRITARSGVLNVSQKIMTEIDAFLTTPGLHLLGFSVSKTLGTPLIAGPDSKIGGYYASRVFAIGTTRKARKNGTNS